MSVTSAILSANPRLIFLIVLTSILGLLLYRDRENVQRQSILFFRRTKHGVEHIDKIAKLSPRFWNLYGWAGVLFGVLTIPFILWQVIVSTSQAFSSGGAGGGASIVAPGLSGEATFQSGISFIPIEYWIISVGVLMFVHELSHGIVARAEDMEINSVGWIVLGIIPGAFVEPKGEDMLPEKGEDAENESDEGKADKEDEVEDADGVDQSAGHWNQGSWTSQLKVLAAGSFANYLTALIFAAVALLMFTQVTHSEGVFYVAQDDYPAKAAGMNNGTMYSINNERVRYPSEVINISEKFSPNDTVTLNTSEGRFNVTFTEKNGSAYMGILMFGGKSLSATMYDMIHNRRVIKPKYEGYEGFLSWTISMFEMAALLNLLIGMFNMLPAKPLDGGQMVGVVFQKFLPDGDRYLNYWSLGVWIILLGSIAYSLAPL